MGSGGVLQECHTDDWLFQYSPSRIDGEKIVVLLARAWVHSTGDTERSKTRTIFEVTMKTKHYRNFFIIQNIVVEDEVIIKYYGRHYVDRIGK